MAAKLYCAGYAKYVLPSGKYSSNVGRFASENIDNPSYAGEYETDFEYCKYILMKNGVPEHAIICEDQATNSMENAEFSLKVLEEKGVEVKKAILCCQAFHARRAFMSYGRYFPNVKILVVPTDTQGITRDNWFKTRETADIVLGEIERCGSQFHEIVAEYGALEE